VAHTDRTAQAASTESLHLGTTYAPELWPEDRWMEDARRMREAGLSLVRMAEFAWSTLQPVAGRYDFEWLDRAIACLAAEEIVTVLATPTAALPPWLVAAVPDVQAVDESGRRIPFGNRGSYCVNSPGYKTAARRLVRAMARRFGPNPHVIGWQIHDETSHVCFCERCQDLFQQHLKARYGSLKALNEHWATRSLGLTYSGWNQIPIPTVDPTPGMEMELRHFATECRRRFQRSLFEVLRPYLNPGVCTLQEFPGWDERHNSYRLAAEVDRVAEEWQVDTTHRNSLTAGAIHDLIRGLKRRNFWLVETQAGPERGSASDKALSQGEARALAWQAVAHGAEAICIGEWRCARSGQQKHGGPLVDQEGQPRSFLEEVKQIGRELNLVSTLIAGSVVKARVAMLHCYDSYGAIGGQPPHADFDYLALFNLYYRSLAARNANVDVLSADEPLDGYRLVIAPALAIINEKRVTHLEEFARRGGCLVLTLPGGSKDEFNALLPARPPGALSGLAGIQVEDSYALSRPIPVKANFFEGTSRFWAERLKLLDSDERRAIPVAHYGQANGWLDGQIAVAVHPYGGGMVYYVGAYLDEAPLQALMNNILNYAGIQPIQTPLGVEVRTRTTRTGEEIHFVINHGSARQAVPLAWPAREQLSAQEIRGELLLPPYGVALLTKIAPKSQP
jgi:beta-galactosidase